MTGVAYRLDYPFGRDTFRRCLLTSCPEIRSLANKSELEEPLRVEDSRSLDEIGAINIWPWPWPTGAFATPLASQLPTELAQLTMARRSLLLPNP